MFSGTLAEVGDVKTGVRLVGAGVTGGGVAPPPPPPPPPLLQAASVPVINAISEISRIVIIAASRFHINT